MTEKNEKKKTQQQWSNDSFNFSFKSAPWFGGLVKIGSVLEDNALKYFNFEEKK